MWPKDDRERFLIANNMADVKSILNHPRHSRAKVSDKRYFVLFTLINGSVMGWAGVLEEKNQISTNVHTAEHLSGTDFNIPYHVYIC